MELVVFNIVFGFVLNPRRWVWNTPRAVGEGRGSFPIVWFWRIFAVVWVERIVVTSTWKDERSNRQTKASRSTVSKVKCSNHVATNSQVVKLLQKHTVDSTLIVRSFDPAFSVSYCTRRVWQPKLLSHQTSDPGWLLHHHCWQFWKIIAPPWCSIFHRWWWNIH